MINMANEKTRIIALLLLVKRCMPCNRRSRVSDGGLLRLNDRVSPTERPTGRSVIEIKYVKEIPMAVEALGLTLLSVEGADDDWTIRIRR